MESTEPMDREVRQARSGDRDAFAALVREHQAMVFSIAAHFLRNDAVAEELAQEVFLDLHQNLGSLESSAHVTFWLRRVTTHRCIDYARRRKHRPFVALDGVLEPSASPSPDDPFLATALRKLTATLSDSAQMVITMRFQEDLEPAEIAKVLDMPVNTVKSHLQRSLATLREKLERLKVRA